MSTKPRAGAKREEIDRHRSPQYLEARERLRSLYDPGEMGDQVRDRVLRAVERNFETPIESRSGRLRMELVGPVEVEATRDPFNYGAIADTLGESGTKGTYGSRIKGRIRITEKDSDGKETIHDDSEVTLGMLPTPIFDRSFVIDGRKRYLPSAQFRRKPGVFTYKDSRDQFKSEFNLDHFTSSRVPPFSIYLDQKSDDSKLNLSFRGRDTQVPAWHLAKALGADEKTFKKTLGEDVAANLLKGAGGDKEYEKSVRAIYDRVRDTRSPITASEVSIEDAVKVIREEFGKSRIDPEVSKLTLGSPISVVGPTAIMKAMSRTFNVASGDEAADNRDSLSFKQAVAPYDMLAEAVGHEKEVRALQDRVRSTLSGMERRMNQPNSTVTPKVKRIIGDTIDKRIKTRLTASQVQRGDSGTNPLDGWSQTTITTLMGEGAISSEQSIPESAKALDGSQLGTIDPTHTPESSLAGINVHLSSGAKVKYKEGSETAHTPGYSQILTQFLDKNGNTVELDPADRQGKVVGSFDQYTLDSKGRPKGKEDIITAFIDGNPTQVKSKDVEFWLPNSGSVLDVSTGLIPFGNSTQGNRAQYAAKQLNQTVPLKFREAPLVQVKTPGGEKSLEALLSADAGAKFSPVDGVVKKVTEGKGAYARSITLAPEGGGKDITLHLPKNFPMPGQTAFDSTVKVKEGQKVKAGDLLSDSTFTQDGVLALGTNLRVGYMPWKTDTFEDSIVISSSAASKLTSEHLHRETVESPRTTLGLAAYNRAAGAPISNAERDSLDEFGIIKEGSKVVPGQLLMIGSNEVDLRRTEDRTLQRLKLLKGDSGSSIASSPFQKTWGREFEGEVVSVTHKKVGNKVVGADIVVKTEEEMRAGDKIFGRHGNKGVISRVIPDSRMPKVKGVVEITNPGKSKWRVGQEVPEAEFNAAKDLDDTLQAKAATLEILFNPMGVPSRINPSQNLETFLGKVARHNNKEELVDNFGYGSNYDYVAKKLKDSDVSDTETIVDPETGREIRGIGVGVQYITKAKQTVVDKNSARGLGTFNPDTGAVVKGEDGAQLTGELGIYGLLSQNAREVIRDTQLNKTEFRQDVVKALREGRPIPRSVKYPEAFNRFQNYLKAAGVNPTDNDAGQFQLKPLTDTDVKNMTRTATGIGKFDENIISKPFETLRGKHEDLDKAAIKGGLFDPSTVGGNRATSWSRFELSTKLPNPVYEQSIVDLLGITKTDFKSILEGSKQVEFDKEGDDETGGKRLTGSAAIEGMLKSIDLESARKDFLAQSTGSDRADKRSQAFRAIRMIDSLTESGVRPEDAFMRQQVAVLPLNMRGIRKDNKGNVVVDDVNYLYRDIGLIDKELREARENGLPAKAIAEIEGGLYNSMTALMQTEGSVPVGGKYQGILGTLSGIRWDSASGNTASDPRASFFRREVLNRRQAFSARAVLTPDNDLEMDEVGLPRNMAAALLEEDILRLNRARGGVDKEGDESFTAELDDYIKKGVASSKVDGLLEQAVRDKHMIVKRDPVLHQYGIQGFRPVLLPSDRKAMALNPLVYGGFGADNDGDCIIGEIVVNLSRANLGVGAAVKLPTDGEEYVHTDELLTDGWGVIRIEDLPYDVSTEVVRSNGRVKEYDVKDGVRVPAWCPETHSIRLFDVTKFSIHEDCAEVICSFKSGRTVTCSDSHSLAVLDPDTLEVVKSVPHQSVGLCSPGLGKSPSLETTHVVVDPEGLSLPGTFETGWWLGALIGDGWSAEKQVILSHGVTEELQAVGSKWVEISNSLFPESNVSYAENEHLFDGRVCKSAKRILLNSSVTGRVANLIGKGAHGKHLPPEFLKYSLETLRGLFCGLVDTDGSSCWSNRADDQGGPQYLMTYSTKSLQLAQEVRILGNYVGIRSHLSEFTRVGRTTEYTVRFYSSDVQEATWLSLVHPSKQEAVNTLFEATPRKGNQKEIKPLPPRVASFLMKFSSPYRKSEKGSEGPKTWSTWYTAVARSKGGFMPAPTATAIATFISSVDDAVLGEDSTYIKKWAGLVLAPDIEWDALVDVTPTGDVKTMYDITVPGSLTFTLGNGLVVWDTLAISLPLSKEANDEVRDKMLPSKNLFNPSSGKLEFMLSHEAVSGVSRLSRRPTPGEKPVATFSDLKSAEKAWEKNEIETDTAIKIGEETTTLGNSLVDSVLPEGFRLKDREKAGALAEGTFALTKGPISSVLSDVAMASPESFATVANDLRKLGQKYSSYSGLSVTMEDLKPVLVEDRKTAGKNLSKKMYDITRSRALSEAEKERAVKETYSGVMNRLSSDARKGWMESLKEKRPNSLVEMVSSGARGNYGQLEQMLMAPVAVLDSQDKVIRTPIMRNYTEGLSASDYWAAANGARKGAINKVVQVQDPGSLSKQLINTTMDLVVSEVDCGTTAGTTLDLSDPANATDAAGRTLTTPLRVGSVSFNAGHTLTAGEVGKIRREGKGAIRVGVRSPMTCKAKNGICQKCAGYAVDGTAREIGFNQGVVSAQSIGERSTQLMLSSFHSGGRFDPKGGTAGDLFGEAQALLRMPKNMTGNAAILAKADEKVTGIKEDKSRGGYVLNAKSDAGANEYFIPKSFTAPDGTSKVQDYFKPGMQLSRGGLLTGGLANPANMLAVTGDVGKTKEYMADSLHNLFKGHGIQRRHVETVVHSMTSTVEVKNPGTSNLLPGHRLPAVIAESMKEEHPTLEVVPVIKGVNVAPRELREDYMAQLNSTNIRKSLTQSIARSATSDIHGLHPIPGMGAALEFNRPGPNTPGGSY